MGINDHKFSILSFCLKEDLIVIIGDYGEFALGVDRLFQLDREFMGLFQIY